MLTANLTFLFFPFFGMFYIKNRITSAIPILEANIYLCWKQTRPIMCRLNINKCHSCRTAGNSNFTLFLMVYFSQRLLSSGFHLNAWYFVHRRDCDDLQVMNNTRDQIFWLKLFDKNKKERVAILGSTLHASKISSCHFTLHASAHDRLFGGYYIFKYCWILWSMTNIFIKLGGKSNVRCGIVQIRV
jgi:hypothetical protein